MAEAIQTTTGKSQSTLNTVKKLGLVAATSLVIGNMIGSGIFLLPSSLAPYGLLSVAGWLITSFGALMLALVFAKLSQIIVGAGGPYTYSRVAFGDFAGFWIAWGYWIALWVSIAGVTVAFIGYAAAFFPGLNTNNRLAGAVAILMIWLLTFINLRGADLAGKVQTVSTVIKVIPLVIIGLMGLLYFNSANLAHWAPSVSQPSTYRAIQAVVALTLWSYLGLESAAVATDTIENPTKTIPRATLIGTIFVAVVYILSSTAVLGLVPASTLEASTFPFATAAETLWGPAAFYFVAFCAAVSCLGAANGFILITPQVSMAAAKDRLFPGPFARRTKTGVPAWGMIVAAILESVVLALNYSGSKDAVEIFNFIILLATLTTLVPYVFCSMAEVMIFFTDREKFSGQRLGASITIAVLAFLYSVYAIVGSGATAVMWGFVLLLGGIPVYVWMRKSGAEGEEPPARL
jgi:basic amino acid/polyamine antiporter, APA family